MLLLAVASHVSGFVATDPQPDLPQLGFLTTIHRLHHLKIPTSTNGAGHQAIWCVLLFASKVPANNRRVERGNKNDCMMQQPAMMVLRGDDDGRMHHDHCIDQMIAAASILSARRPIHSRSHEHNYELFTR